jgi:hypothetical protein
MMTKPTGNPRGRPQVYNDEERLARRRQVQSEYRDRNRNDLRRKALERYYMLTRTQTICPCREHLADVFGVTGIEELPPCVCGQFKVCYKLS